MSNLLKRSDQTGLSDDIHITPAGGASEAVYIATFMVGQNLDVVALFDSDKEGENSAERLTKRWLTQYSSGCASTLMVADAIKAGKKNCAIEDIFTAEFYLCFVNKTYSKDLGETSINGSQLRGNEQLVKRVERICKDKKINFNKGSVLKRIKSYLDKLPNTDKLPSEIPERAQSLM